MSEVFMKRRLWMPTASPLCLAGDSPCRKTPKQPKQEESSTEEAQDAAQEVAPAATCRIAYKKASRHLARNVTRMSLTVGGGDSRQDIVRRGNIKREQGDTGLIERRRWLMRDDGLRHSGGLWLEICLGLIWLASFPQGDARRGPMNIC